MRIQILFLRFFIVALALFDLALGLFALWRMPPRLAIMYGNPGTAYVAGFGMYVIFICLLAACWFTWQLLNRVNRKQAFTDQALVWLRDLKHAATGIAIGFGLMLPQIYVTAQNEDAPGLILMVFFAAILPLAVAAILAILERLWAEVIINQTKQK